MRKRKKVPRFCDYGCGRVAKYYFTTAKKWCCEAHYMRCPIYRKLTSERSTGCIGWNKGLTKKDHPGIQKQASKMSGKKFTEEHKKKISKAHRGKIFSEETRMKMSKAAKIRSSTKEYKKNWVKQMTSPQALAKKRKSTQWYYDSIKGVPRPEHSLKLSGQNHFNWQGGISVEPYCDAWADREFKEDIKRRDDYTCQLCGSKEDLCIHHVDYDKKNCSPDNLLTLCRGCNTRVNFNRKSWLKFFTFNCNRASA